MSGWDCHAHVFGPYARYPLAAGRSYTPPEAPCEDYLGLLARLGLSNGVLVHPSAYGDDHRLLLEVLAAHPQLRGVIVARADSPPALRSTPALRSLRTQGVRAARFSHRSGAGTNFAGSASLADLLALAPALADAGLHAELWTVCAVLPDIADRLRTLPVPVVVDHMGGFDAAAGVDAPGFRTLRGLLESGRGWVKLCAYRNLPPGADLEPLRPFHDALAEANPTRLLWGTDWPHLRWTPAPDAGVLLQTLRRWTTDAAVLERVLVSNPATLYG